MSWGMGYGYGRLWLYTVLTGTLSDKILPSNIPSPTVFAEYFNLWYYDRSSTLVPVNLFSKQCKGWFFSQSSHSTEPQKIS